MSKNKPTPGGRATKKTEVSLVRSSAAEYLTFVAASGQGGVEAVVQHTFDFQRPFEIVVDRRCFRAQALGSIRRVCK